MIGAFCHPTLVSVVKPPLNATYQTEGTQNGQSLDVSESQLYQTQHYNDDIKTIPPVFQVVDGA